MITTLLMTLEGSRPEVSRCVNVEDSMDLGTLSQVIDAAFGFSGAATHLYSSGTGEFRQVYSETPGAGESDEATLTVAKFTEITYIYDPTANWNVRVEALGYSQLDGPTPLLVDACGPDIVEAAGGTEMMTKFREEARRVCAGLEPNMEITPLLLSFMPVMSPERMLDRLTVADPVTVATRIGYVAEEIYFDQPDGPDGVPGGPVLAEQFEEFLDSRPDLRAILQDDPSPDMNPTLLAAVAEFFEDALGGEELGDDELGGEKLGDDELGAGGAGDQIAAAAAAAGVADGPRAERLLADTLQDLVRCFTAPVALTKLGHLPVSTVRSFVEILRLPNWYKQPREQSFASISNARSLLSGAGLIADTDGSLAITERGRSFLAAADPAAEFSTELLLGFETLYGKRTWKTWVRILGELFGVQAFVGWDHRMPADYQNVFEFLVDLGVIATGPGDMQLTPGGRVLLEQMVASYSR